jgi:mannitol-1-phosphate/altronate dehydrogenase
MTIKLENPSIEHYIKEIGKENLEKMILSFLDIKSKLNQLPVDKIEGDSFQKAIEFGVNIELHKKILSMKSTNNPKSQKMHRLRDEISHRLNNTYTDKSVDEIRDEYFISKGYL